ncbi:MAG: hypothetical protein JWO14_2216 [Solirubrobacterales bacterium]|nr:hypothetical protein [Solirubrobacterales bacterium]
MTFLQTLVAFLLGGVVTLTTQLILEARRESRSRIQRDEETETETKMAARLIVLDLISMLALLKAARQTGRWWNALQLPTTAWDSHSEALSRVLSDEIWRTVGSTFAGAAAWNDLVLGARRYYWVMPRLNLRRLGLVDMHDALREGAAEGLRSCCRSHCRRSERTIHSRIWRRRRSNRRRSQLHAEVRRRTEAGYRLLG